MRFYSMADDNSGPEAPANPDAESAARGRGRPEWNPTKAQRHQISVLAGGGMPQDAIALLMGVSTPTLQKHCGQELTVGALQRRAEVMDAMFKAGKKGNVAAAKAYCLIAPVVAKPKQPEEEKPSEAPAPAPTELIPATPTLGIKAQRKADAHTAEVGSAWERVLPQSPPPDRLQ